MLELLLVLQCVLYVVLCPYTKVEESFNLQAVHDILYHGTNLSEYDHHEFPGVVPRSFIGPLVVAGLSYPLVNVAGLCGASKHISQYIVRSVLGVCVCLAMIAFSRAVKKWLGPLVATLTLLQARRNRSGWSGHGRTNIWASLRKKLS
jgi:alpha-1,6-mannosyltransferase